jgi:hypothetical protein
VEAERYTLERGYGAVADVDGSLAHQVAADFLFLELNLLRRIFWRRSSVMMSATTTTRARQNHVFRKQIILSGVAAPKDAPHEK